MARSEAITYFANWHEHHLITFFSFYANHVNDVHRELKNIFEKVVCIPLDLPAPKSLREFRDYGFRLLTRQPYNISKYCRPQVRTELRRLLQRESYDVILCDFVFAAGVIPWDWPTPKVLFTHNVESVIWHRHYQVAKNSLWKVLSWREWRTMESAERKYLSLANHVLTVSEDDRQFFCRYIDPARLSVIPTGADTQYFRPTAEQEIPSSLVFTGSMDWLPNEDGMVNFIQEVLPLIRQQVPDISLVIMGRKPSQRLKELAAGAPNVRLTGWVEDIRPFVARGGVCVVPLRVGGGTRLKIFEAMSMGKAVVSTTIGAEGLPVKHGEHLLIADDPITFANSTVNLLRDPAQRRELGSAARKLVEERYSWVQVARGFAEVLAKVVGEVGS